MAYRLVRHPAVLIAALAVATVVGAVSVGSLVQVVTVGTSRLGLESPAGIALSIVLATLSMGTIAAIMVGILRWAGGGDDEDWRGGDDDAEPPPTDGPYGEPEWWPDFERELAAYAAQRDRRRQRDDAPLVGR
jgi:hypothetical protein